MFASGSNAVLPETAVITSEVKGESTSATLTETSVGGASSSSVTLATGAMVGASFTGLTVTLKVRLLRPKVASMTVSVMAAVPKRLVTGVKVRVRLVWVPPKMRLFVGSSEGFDDTATRLRLLAVVCESRTVNASGPAVVSSLIVRLVRPARVGSTLLLSLMYVRKRLVTLAPPLSVTITVTVLVPTLLLGRSVSVPLVAPPV